MTGTEALIIGTVVSAAGSIFGGFQQASQQRAMADQYRMQAELQRQEAERSAIIAEQDAERAREAAEFEAARTRRRGSQIAAAQRVAYAAAGIVVDEGSPLLIVEETAVESERDALTVLYEGEVQAQRLEDTARMSRWTGEVLSLQSSYAADVASSQATGAIISGFARAAGSAATGYVDYRAASGPVQTYSGGRYGGGFTRTAGGTRVDWMPRY